MWPIPKGFNMTSAQTHQEYESVTMRNVAFLEQGMRANMAQADSIEPTASALMLGQLQTLSAMLVAGDAGEKEFSRKRLKKFIADGKRLDSAKAKRMPINTSKTAVVMQDCSNCKVASSNFRMPCDPIEMGGEGRCKQ
jgi:hypothetical protein